MFHHLLVPTDGSQMAEMAIERAVAFAKSSGAEITFSMPRKASMAAPIWPSLAKASPSIQT